MKIHITIIVIILLIGCANLEKDCGSIKGDIGDPNYAQLGLKQAQCWSEVFYKCVPAKMEITNMNEGSVFSYNKARLIRLNENICKLEGEQIISGKKTFINECRIKEGDQFIKKVDCPN